MAGERAQKGFRGISERGGVGPKMRGVGGITWLWHRSCSCIVHATTRHPAVPQIVTDKTRRQTLALQVQLTLLKFNQFPFFLFQKKMVFFFWENFGFVSYNSLNKTKFCF